MKLYQALLFWVLTGSLVLILTSGLLVAADGPGKDDPPKDDLDQLRGTWLTVSLVNDGKTLVDEKVPPQGGANQVKPTEVAQPPSVTESMTELLDDDSDSRHI